MTDTETAGQVRAAEIIKIAMRIQDDADAADMLDGQLMAEEAFRHPEMYLILAEAFFAEKRLLPVMTVWRLFTETLREHAHDYAQEPLQYNEAVYALQGFVALFQKDEAAFAPFDLFSDAINAAIDDFDEATIGDRPAERFRKDKLLNGDRALEYGDDLAAAQFYKAAAEEDGKPEGWLRLLQLLAEVDLGQAYGLGAAEEACDKATAAGLWYARAYYLQRLASVGEEDAAGVITGDRRALMAMNTRGFLADLADYAAPLGMAAGFSKYLAPTARHDSVAGIFAQPSPEDILARLGAVSQANAVKSAVSVFLPQVMIMRRQGWIDAADIETLPRALDLFEAVLADENAQVQSTAAQSSPVAGGVFETEQQVFHDMATEMNAVVSEIIAETRHFLGAAV